MTRGSFREVSYRHVIVNRVLGVGGGGGRASLLHYITLHDFQYFSKQSLWMDEMCFKIFIITGWSKNVKLDLKVLLVIILIIRTYPLYIRESVSGPVVLWFS